MPVVHITDEKMKDRIKKGLDRHGSISGAARYVDLSRQITRKYAIRYGLWPRKKMKQAA